MKVFLNYPKTEDGKKILVRNIATFKAELFLESINNLNIEDKAKDEVLEKVLEILCNKSNNNVI